MPMGLCFVLGASGVGKTEWMYTEALKKAEENENRTVLFIVPEQFSLQTMNELLRKSKSKSMANIEVLSFARLTYRVFSELSVDCGELLSDTGKSMLLKRVLMQNAEKLLVFGSNTKKPGFLDELKSFLSECYQYGITPELLQRKAEEEHSELLSRKLRDIALLFQNFSEEIKGEFQPSETVFDLLSGVLGRSKVFRNCYCFMDGFTGFTPSQYSLLRTLFTCSSEVWLSLTGDETILTENQKEHQLFYFTGRTLQTVEKLAGEAGCRTSRLLLSERDHQTRFHGNAALSHLEKGMFRYPVRKKISCEDRISIISRQNRRAEASFIAADIERRVRTEGLRYGKIAIVTGDVFGYGTELLMECQKAGIPAFLDSKRKIVHNPCTAIIRAVLQNAKSGFSYETVFRYLKCGFSRVTAEETAKLENYCIECGIRGESSWKKEWKFMQKRGTEEGLSHLNELREKVISELQGITESLKREKTAGGKTRAIYDFLNRMEVEEQLFRLSEQFEKENNPEKSGEYRQIFAKVIRLFDHFVRLLGTVEMDLSEYIELCETGLSEFSFCLVPNGTDFVVIGDMTRTRLSDIDVLYLCGANEGVTPTPAGTGGLISEDEREQLKQERLQLAPGRRESVFMEQFYLYQMLTKPRKRLVITFSRLSLNGDVCLPSRFLRRITELFTDLEVKTGEERKLFKVLQNDLGKEAFLQSLRKYAQTGELPPELVPFLFVEKKEEEEHLEKLLQIAFFGNPAVSISEKTARRMYGEILYGSATRFELFASCAYAHFLKYGLSLKERSEYTVSSPELGTLYHEALRLFMERMKKEESMKTLTDEQCNICAFECVSEATQLFKNGVFEGSGHNSFLLEKTKKLLARTIQMMLKQLRGSLFAPDVCEADYQLLDKSFSLHGRIDRIDFCRNEGINYLRVLDYKSSEKKPDLSEAYYGLQIQLLVYLKAAKQLLEQSRHCRLEVAGVFYAPIKDPYLEREKYSEENEQKEYRPNGLINCTPSALTALDVSLNAKNGGLMPDSVSKLINAETNSEGELKKNASLLYPEDFTALSDFVTEKLKVEADEIQKGEVNARPARYKKKTPCEYCAYSEVCGFDLRLPEFSCRECTPVTREDVIKPRKGDTDADFFRKPTESN